MNFLEERYSKKENFREWFNWIIQRAEICHVGYPVQGIFPYLPWGAEIFNRMREIYEKKLEEKDHKRILFPTLIPESLFKKETDFFSGFSPEAYTVTETLRGRRFGEKLILRPTSEVPIYWVFAQKIRSWKQLPLKVFQTVSIFRCETKMTAPLLRLREVFGFNEVHTFHATEEEMNRQVIESREICEWFIGEVLRIPYIVIEVPKWDLFPGASFQYDIMTILGDGKLLELVSAIGLRQKFAKAFEIKFQDKDMRWKYCWQTCTGIGFDRCIAALISCFGEDKELFFPAEISPYQAVIIPIYTSENKEKVLKYCRKIEEVLKEKGFKVKLDDREEKTPGEKFYEWELYGVPFRIEIGEREVNEEKITVALRFIGRREMKIDEFIEKFWEMNEEIKMKAFEKAKEEILERISFDESKIADVYIIEVEREEKGYLEMKAEELGRNIIGKFIKSNFMELEERKNYWVFGRTW